MKMPVMIKEQDNYELYLELQELIRHGACERFLPIFIVKAVSFF